MRKLICSLLCLSFLTTGAGCLNNPRVEQPKGNPLGVIANQHFGLTVKQNGRDVPISKHSVVLDRAAFDLIFAFPVPSGIFINASEHPDFARQAVAGANIVGLAPLKGLADTNPSVLELTDKKWQYWYYLGPGISKFTEVKEVKAPQGGRVTWVCRKTLRGYRASAGTNMDLQNYPYDDMYLVIIKGDWDSGHTQRVEQAREVLQIRFK